MAQPSPPFDEGMSSPETRLRRHPSAFARPSIHPSLYIHPINPTQKCLNLTLKIKSRNEKRRRLRRKQGKAPRMKYIKNHRVMHNYAPWQSHIHYEWNKGKTTTKAPLKWFSFGLQKKKYESMEIILIYYSQSSDTLEPLEEIAWIQGLFK